MGDFNLTPQQPANGFTVLELCCGGGLGAIGFKAAGYNIVKALDFDKNAVKAYRHNFGDNVEQADINAVDIDSLPNTDVIFGGPPCQDFSVAGKGAGADGERGKLVWRYLEIIAAKQPKAFVFENVKGLITKRHRPTFDALIEKFNEIGYEIEWKALSAWDYGVAQKRERVGLRSSPEARARVYRRNTKRPQVHIRISEAVRRRLSDASIACCYRGFAGA
ncbi:DNA cytosine methyltransferase [Bacillus velezensis]|uniref:DNA cytosine methyltransferase n=1 Tax=Bacillus velezensis TaxID=492670 RepID=UPI0034E4A184